MKKHVGDPYEKQNNSCTESMLTNLQIFNTFISKENVYKNVLCKSFFAMQLYTTVLYQYIISIN